ncbi:hypothetical protein ASG90_03835 [Nocardioides sp. Soil797]|nr:hypothetical protein ASG90_03835 [Nocardioides sp. Soil797]
MTETSQNAIRSYRPGGWYAIFGEHASVLLPESEKPRVAALWELVDSGAGFDELLDALIATGLRSLPGFVLVSTAEEPTRIVLRGSARAEVTLGNGEQASVDGGAAATWVEKALPDVASLQLVLEDDGEAVDFGIRAGLVRVSRIDQPPYAANEGAATDSAVAAAAADTDTSAEAAAPVDSPDAAVAVPVAGEAPAEDAPEPQVDADESEAAAGAELGSEAEPAAEAGDVAGDSFAPSGGAYAAPVVGAFASAPVGGAHAGEPQFEESQPEEAAQPGESQPEEAVPFADDQHAGPEQSPADDLVDDQPTEAHAFPFFNDIEEPEEAPAQPAFDGQADQQSAAEQPVDDRAGVPETPDDGQQQAPSEPVWGQAPQGNAYAPPEAPSNPFAPGAAAPEPPMWTPPAQPDAPQWGAPSEQQPAEAPAWGGGQSAQGDVDHDGHTQAGTFNPGEFARQHPGIPGQPQAPSVTAQPVARLVFSNGETIDVDRAVLVGRAPEARRFTSTDQPRLVTVTSPNQEISSTHLEVRPGSGVDHGSAIVTDMGSTNGTVLTQPGFAPEDLQPGIAVQLLPGSVIDLGDGVTIQVTSV